MPPRPRCFVIEEEDRDDDKNEDDDEDGTEATDTGKKDVNERDGRGAIATALLRTLAAQSDWYKIISIR